MSLSVVLTTHNPHAGRLQKTLQGLRAQTLPASDWELVLVDNVSATPITPAQIDPDGTFSNLRILRENRIGSSYGRCAGAIDSHGDIIVFVDDDNVLDPDYLANTMDIFRRHPTLGMGGGKRFASWEDRPPAPWMHEFLPLLAINVTKEDEPGYAELERYYGSEHLNANEVVVPYDAPWCMSPLGAGMIARKQALRTWTKHLHAGTGLPGRVGKRLECAEDHEMVICAGWDGWHIGYFPQLTLLHLIPQGRLTREYLARLNHAIHKSHYELLVRYGLGEHQPASRMASPLRKARAYLRHRAWNGPAAYVRWRGACGVFDSRVSLGDNPERLPMPERRSDVDGQ